MKQIDPRTLYRQAVDINDMAPQGDSFEALPEMPRRTAALSDQAREVAALFSDRPISRRLLAGSLGGLAGLLNGLAGVFGGGILRGRGGKSIVNVYPIMQHSENTIIKSSRFLNEATKTTSSRFFREATNTVSSRFFREATGIP